MQLKKALYSILALAMVAAGTLASVQAQAQKDVAIGGYCPVAYSAAGMASKGDAKFTSVVEGRTYQLTNAMVKEMFDKEPAKFTPAFKGYCATGVAKGMKLEVDPTQYVIEGGKTYVFSSADAKKMFEMDKAGTIKAANANWAKVDKMPVSKMGGN
jgi:YHS domain-containing protein